MRRLILLVAAAALLGSTVATVDVGASNPRARAKKVRLARFDSCKRLVRYARHYAPRERRYISGPVRAPGTAAPESAPTPGAGDTSHTNVQEAGVGEPDIVKTDGTNIFAIAGSRLNAVDARAATPKLVGSLDLGTYGGQMFLRHGRAFVFSAAGSPVEVAPGRGAASMPIYYRPATEITEVDVTDP